MLDAEHLVRTCPLLPDEEIPLLLEPATDGLNLVRWAEENHSHIEKLLAEHRAILLRNFDVKDIDTFERFVRAVSDGDLLHYQDRTSPRTAVASQVYTSTVYPAEGNILLHTESSYSKQWALKICFCCMTAAEEGGETPIADVRKVLKRIDPEVQQLFRERKWMLRRSYSQGLGLPWQEVFQTENKDEVESKCQENKIELEWLDDQHLVTKQIRPAIHTHPRTQEELWFNHISFFHWTSLETDMRKALMADLSPEDLPYNTYFGDGTAIEPDVVAHIRDAWAQEEISYPWQEGDLLLLDNMTVAHGRHSYKGDRKVLVAMTEPHGLGQ